MTTTTEDDLHPVGVGPPFSNVFFFLKIPHHGVATLMVMSLHLASQKYLSLEVDTYYEVVAWDVSNAFL